MVVMTRLRVYLKEIGKVSLISGDKEVFLAKRIENGENIIEETILNSSLVRTNFFKLRAQSSFW